MASIDINRLIREGVNNRKIDFSSTTSNVTGLDEKPRIFSGGSKTNYLSQDYKDKASQNLQDKVNPDVINQSSTHKALTATGSEYLNKDKPGIMQQIADKAREVKDMAKEQVLANPKTAGAVAGAGLAAGAIGAGLAAKKYLATRKAMK